LITLKNFLLVGLGGAVGSMLRYAFSVFFISKSFPTATILVNIVGSFAIGAIFAMSNKDENFLLNWKVFLATGLCGGFTTFSAFSIENIQLLQSHKYLQSLIYILATVILGLAAAFTGYKLINNTA
jgi:fluoride exporter